MMLKKLSGYLALIVALVISQGTYAQDDEFLLDEGPVDEPKPVYTSEIELGVGWQSQDSFKFGEFSGLTDRGPFIIGNFRISRRDAWDSGGTQYLLGLYVSVEMQILA